MTLLEDYKLSDSELRDWAYDANAVEPQQDFDLILASEPRDIYFDFAADLNCPGQRYFLKVLYLIVGDAVRTDYNTNTRAEIEKLLEQGRQRSSVDLQLWVERSEKLIANPEHFDYDEWCDGGLAYGKSSR